MKLRTATLKLFSLPFGSGNGYFLSHPGRNGFFPTQLSGVHGLPKQRAVQASFIFNRWLDILELLSEHLKPGQLTRMTDCTYKFSSIERWKATCCRSNLCPWCSAYKALDVVKKLNEYNAQGMLYYRFLDHRNAKIRPPDDAILGVKTFYQDGKTWAVEGVIFTKMERDAVLTSKMISESVNSLILMHKWLYIPENLEEYTKLVSNTHMVQTFRKHKLSKD